MGVVVVTVTVLTIVVVPPVALLLVPELLWRLEPEPEPEPEPLALGPPAAAAEAVGTEELEESELLEEDELDELFEEPLVESPSSTSVRLSCASVRLASASSSVSSADDGSRVAISCPFLTWSPTLTLTVWSVPDVAKLSVSSTPGCTSPLPETVVWMTPFSAVTFSFEMRAEVAVDVPSWVTPKMITAAATAASRMTYQGRADRRLEV